MVIPYKLNLKISFINTLDGILFILFFGIFGSSRAQTHQQNIYLEYKDDDYLNLAPEKRSLSKAYSYLGPQIDTRQINTDSLGNNILKDAGNEPSLAIDPLNPNRMVVGWRQFDNVFSNFRKSGIAFSLDAGKSWKSIRTLDGDRFRTDPVLCSDARGTFYYNSLDDKFSCDVFKSEDLEDWNDKTYAFGGDKQWMVIDKTKLPSEGNIYVLWKAELSSCQTNNFTRSTNRGLSYEECTLLNSNPIRGSLEVGPEGELYACGGWANTYRVAKSYAAKNPLSDPSWDFEVIVDLKGSQAVYDGPNPGGMLGQAWIATDHSDNPSRGHVYLVCTTKRTDNNDPADIMFSKSIDGGISWSEAIKINKDNSTNNWQWFGSMSVAPNGRIDVSWLDTRDHPGTLLSALYYSYSNDGGNSWSNDVKLSESFDPHLGWPNQNKMGDYFHMISSNEGAHLAWAATFNGEQDIYYSFITPEKVTTAIEHSNNDEMQFKIYPNPAIREIQISIFSKWGETVKISVVDIYGHMMLPPLTRLLKKGRNAIQIDPEYLKVLSSGLYFFCIQNDTGQKLCKKLWIK